MKPYIDSTDEVSEILKKEERDKIVYVNKLDPMNKYMSFGRYTIDLKQLQGGKLQFRTNSGFPVKDLKSKRMTKNMKNIINKLLSNTEILFEDIENLNDEEKSYLSMVAEKCEINDRLKIPSPKLTKIQSDINRFNILRGHIVAGGDSKEAIKEFKILLLKLMNSKHINKTEGNEIMTMLLQLDM